MQTNYGNLCIFYLKQQQHWLYSTEVAGKCFRLTRSSLAGLLPRKSEWAGGISMEKVSFMGGKGIGGFLRRFGALFCLVAVSAVILPAQSVEDRIAALETLLQQQNARIQQLEQELAGTKEISAQARTADPEAGAAGMVREVSAKGDGGLAPFIRPAVLTTNVPLESLATPSSSAEPLEASAAAPVPQGDAKTGLEGLDLFKGVQFSGFLDAYYGYDFNKPGTRKVNYRNFDFNSNSLTLSHVLFDMTKPVSASSPWGYMLQLHFGPTADFVNASDPLGKDSITAKHFLQYYLSGRLPVGKGLTIDVGKFVTQHGAEVIDTRADWNYSRGLLFAWAIPYYHFGVRATYPVSDKVTVAAYLVNGWNSVIDNNGAKTGGFQFVWNPSSRFSFVQNYMVGPEQADDNSHVRHLLDSLITAKLDSKGKVTFMANFDYGLDHLTDSGDSVHWIGAAGYLRFAVSNHFALIPRFEWFNDPQGFATGTVRQQLKEITITPEFLINEHLITRLEYRRDWSNAATFSRGPEESGRSQDTAAAGVILKF